MIVSQCVYAYMHDVKKILKIFEKWCTFPNFLNKLVSSSFFDSLYDSGRHVD